MVRPVFRRTLWTDRPRPGVRLDTSSRAARPSRSPMPRFADPVGQVVDTVEAGLEDLVDEMMVAYAAVLPAYASAPPALLADVRAGAVATVSVGLAQLRGEAGPEGMRAALADVGRRRAQQGIPLPHVLLAYQAGGRVFR